MIFIYSLRLARPADVDPQSSGILSHRIGRLWAGVMLWPAVGVLIALLIRSTVADDAMESAAWPGQVRTALRWLFLPQVAFVLFSPLLSLGAALRTERHQRTPVRLLLGMHLQIQALVCFCAGFFAVVSAILLRLPVWQVEGLWYVIGLTGFTLLGTLQHRARRPPTMEFGRPQPLEESPLHDELVAIYSRVSEVPPQILVQPTRRSAPPTTGAAEPGADSPANPDASPPAAAQAAANAIAQDSLRLIFWSQSITSRRVVLPMDFLQRFPAEGLTAFVAVRLGSQTTLRDETGASPMLRLERRVASWIDAPRWLQRILAVVLVGFIWAAGIGCALLVVNHLPRDVAILLLMTSVTWPILWLLLEMVLQSRRLFTGDRVSRGYSLWKTAAGDPAARTEEQFLCRIAEVCGIADPFTHPKALVTQVLQDSAYRKFVAKLDPERATAAPARMEAAIVHARGQERP